MPHTRRAFLQGTLALSACSALLAAMPAFARQDTVRLVVPFPAGGGGDVLARAVTEVFSQAYGTKFVVDNRPGAGGNVGTRQVAVAKPDGLTLGYVTNGIMCVNAYLYDKLGFDPMRDLVPVGLSTEIGLMAALNPKVLPGVTDLQSLIAYARANPGKVDFASSGNGTTSHLAGLYFAERTGTTLQHIPYRGGAAAMLDVLSGRIPLMIDVAPNVIPHVEAKKLTPLGVTTAERLPSAPDVPTLQEAGIEGFLLSAWDGFVLPKDTPEPIVVAFNQALQAALTDPAVAKRLAGRGAVVKPCTPEDFRAFIASEAPKWAALVRQIRAQKSASSGQTA